MKSSKSISGESSKSFVHHKNKFWSSKRIEHQDDKSNDSIDQSNAKSRAARFRKLDEQSKSEYGFVSRGEEARLQSDPTMQREYFAKIQRAFIEICASVEDKALFREELYQSSAASSAEIQSDSLKPAHDLDWVFLSLRKLREALLAREPDEFIVSVFLFATRIATKIGKYQTYLPSLNFLVSKCVHLLDEVELDEVVTYLVLHISHFNNDNLKASQILNKYIPNSSNTKEILEAWILQDYLKWNSLRTSKQFNLGAYKLMAFGTKKILSKFLQDMEKSYFMYSKKDLKSITGKSVGDINETYGLHWKFEENSDQVVVRERAKVNASMRSGG